jgi:hypothetical protein
MLNPIDQQLIKILYQLKGETIFHLCIESTRKAKSEEKEKFLLSQLRSQAKDQIDANNPIMKNILGTEAYNLLIEQLTTLA